MTDQPDTPRILEFPGSKINIGEKEIVEIRKIAHRTRAFFEAFLEAGFTEDQAEGMSLEMLKILQSGGEQVRVMKEQAKIQLESHKAQLQAQIEAQQEAQRRQGMPPILGGGR